MPAYCLDLTCHNTLARHRGIGRYAASLGRALHAIRGELGPGERLLAATSSEDISDDLRPERHERPLPPTEAQGAAYGRYFRGRWWGLRRTLDRVAPDVVHLVEGPQMLLLRSSRVVVTCHDLIPLLMPRWYIPRRWRNEPPLRARNFLWYHLADRLIAISKATASDLHDLLDIAPERITVIPQGVDHERFHPRAEPGERDDLTRRLGLPPRYALYVGAADPRKRVDLLLRSYRRVYHETRVPLVVVGAWTLRPPGELRALLSDLPPGAVLLLGEVPGGELPPLYRGADLHVLPSVYEGFGLTVLEAMAAGCPVVTTRCGALAEASGEAALHVEPDRVPELEEALIGALRDGAMRDRLRQRGLAHASAFTWERTARATLDVYRQCAGVRAVTREPPPCPGRAP